MIKPHGSEKLIPLFVNDDAQRSSLMAEAETLPSLLISSAAAANAVMLGAGYFTPLTGYMNLADAKQVAKEMKTTDDVFWPVPIVNAVQSADGIEAGQRIALKDPNVEGNPVIAIMDVSAIDLASDDDISEVCRPAWLQRLQSRYGIDQRGRRCSGSWYPPEPILHPARLRHGVLASRRQDHSG